MSEPRVIVDQHERDQAATDLNTTYIVEAAAGTGKTTLLVDRVLTIVCRKQIPLSRVVAITFTEKAAGELKIKLRRKLEAGAQSLTSEAPFFRRALLELDTMPVSTIHSFCRELIQERPVEAGIEPNFGVADQAIAELLRSEVWEEWIAREFSTDCPAARWFLEHDIPVVSRQGFSLRTLYDAILDNREALGELHVESDDDTRVLAQVEDFRVQLAAEVSILSECHNPGDGAAVELQKIVEWLSRGGSGTLSAAEAWLECSPALSGKRPGSQSNWRSKDALECARKLRREFADRVAVLYSHIVSWHARDLIEWLKGAVSLYAQAKAKHNLLDFHDLLLIARDMLRVSLAAREFFKQRFDYLLIDEFQDTDPLQAEIAFYLAEQPAEFAEHWEEVNLVPGKLFIVGDPKQSIYRFRRADLDLYGKVRRLIEQVGQCLNIRVNFRSLPNILDEVNAIFAAHMTGARNGRYEPDYVTLEAYKEDVTALPQTVFLPPPAGWWDSKPLVAGQSRQEAACIAEYIKEQCTLGSRAYREVGILYSATTRLSELEDALRARDIPYQVAGGKKLIERGEVVALRAVVAALDNPFDEMNVVGALRSPFFSCSDEELLEQRLAGADFNYTRSRGAVPHLESCFFILRKLERDKSRCSPSQTVAELFRRTKGLQVYALKPQGEGRVANLLKLLEIARAADVSTGSFHGFARQLASLDETRSGEGDSVTAESGDDVVQLLTFHKAKGLEFPVVILYRLGQDREAQKDSVVVRRGTKAVEFRAGGSVETSGFRAAIDDEQDRNRCEDMRLLYVAMTRARDQLVIPAFWSESRKGFYDLLRERYGRSDDQCPAVDGTHFVLHDTERYSLETPPAELLRIDAEFAASSPEVRRAVERKQQWQADRAAAAELLSCEKAFAAPSHAEEVVQDAVESDETVIRKSEGGALDFGAFVHRLLEIVSLREGGNLEIIARAFAEEYGIRGERIAEGINLVKSALASELFTRVIRADAVYRELPFTDVQDDILWEGSMDLVFVENNQPVIVDFKTDRDVDAEKHRLQMAVYRRALEKISGRPVKELLVYFLRANEVSAIS